MLSVQRQQNLLNGNQGNAQRRLKFLYGIELEPFAIKLDVKDAGGEVVRKDFHILLMWEVLHEVQKIQKQFELSMLGPCGVDGPLHFWDNVATSRTHFVNEDPEWAPYRASTVPVDIHVDGIETYSNVPFLSYSWSSSLVSNICSFDLQFPILIVDEDELIWGVTDVQIVEAINFMVLVLGSGVVPEFDHLGRKLTRKLPSGAHIAAGYFGAFHAWTGDLKEKVQEHKFERNYLANFCCEWCIAHKVFAMYNAFNFDEHADWTHTETTMMQYYMTHVGAERSPWAMVRGWSIWFNLLDLLHLLYLGIVKDFVGTVLFVIASFMGPKVFLNDNLKELWTECCAWCKYHKYQHSIKVFSTNGLRWQDDNDYPEMDKRLKGANCKLVFLWLSDKLKNMADANEQLRCPLT